MRDFAAIVLGIGVALAAAGLTGCRTCPPEEPRVKPQGQVTVGSSTSGNTYRGTSVGLDVTNLFCRAPREPERRPPGAEAREGGVVAEDPADGESQAERIERQERLRAPGNQPSDPLE